MQQAVFYPVWDSFQLADVTEGTGINVQTPLKIRASITLAPYETRVKLSSADAAELSVARKDGAIVSYDLTDDVLTVPQSSRTTLLELERTGSVSFSTFTGQMIPGIHIDASGRLKGIVGNIPYLSPHTYRFGLRAAYGGYTADIIKTWTAIPADGSISWNTATLPAFTIDNTKVASRPYYTLGEFKRGQKIEIGIDLYNPDFTPIEVRYRPAAEMVTGDKRFATLPLGLSISNNPMVISGFLTAEAVPGDYFVELFIDETKAPNPIIVHFSLKGDSFDQFTAVNRLSWVTPVDLGEIIEGHPSIFKVTAQTDDSAEVTYALAPGSRQLPTGLLLASNGEIRGRAMHVAHDRTFEFTVKASSGLFVNTRTFRFKTKSYFATDKHLTIWMPLSGPQRIAWNNYRNQIASDKLFRPNDPNFSVSSRMMLICGLNSRSITSLNYDYPFDVFLGEFKSTRVALGNQQVYDVIYREVVDPRFRAGGFVAGKEDVIADPVFYPQNASIRIQDGTIRNLRSDLVEHLGLNTDATRAKKLGVNGGELLERWMPEGYISAIVVAYVKPGLGKGLAQTMNYGNLPVGTQVHFDRMTVEDGSASYLYYLGWDNNDPDDIVIGAPLPPLDFRVDGVPYDSVVAQSAEPVLSWTSREPDVQYTVKCYNGTTLLRTEELDGATFRYTDTMQNVDANPGHVRFSIIARRGDLISEPLSVAVVIKAGWGYGWGYRYGGATI